MRLEQFEHLLAAAAEVTGQDEFVGVRSRAILGTFDEPPDSILQSMEAEIYPKRVPEAADLIDGNLGDGSQFHAAFGYYAHGRGTRDGKGPPWVAGAFGQASDSCPSGRGSNGSCVVS